MLIYENIFGKFMDCQYVDERCVCPPKPLGQKVLPSFDGGGKCEVEGKEEEAQRIFMGRGKRPVIRTARKKEGKAHFAAFGRRDSSCRCYSYMLCSQLYCNAHAVHVHVIQM